MSDAVAFLLYEIFEKFRTVLFKNRATASGGVEQLAKNQEAVRPFEPRTPLPRMAVVINRNRFLEKTGSQGIDTDVNSLMLLWLKSLLILRGISTRNLMQSPYEL